jgi:hypothetical protein
MCIEAPSTECVLHVIPASQATNPTVINEGLQGLTAGLTAVIATLRMEFAQTVTLGGWVDEGDCHQPSTHVPSQSTAA